MTNDEKSSPIISRKRKSTLNSKKVDTAGVGDFGRDTTPVSSVISQPNSASKDNAIPAEYQSTIPEETVNVVRQAVPNEVDFRRKATKTQKMSSDVILKLNTLKPYIKDLEEMGSDGNPSINDIVNMLLDNYINTKLSTRQLQGYKAVYQN
ncbi:hypothetical protein GNZ82_14075, partial [Listeria monocytogenes]|nr:hypothetical protein [Listeria monocytogenes]